MSSMGMTRRGLLSGVGALSVLGIGGSTLLTSCAQGSQTAGEKKIGSGGTLRAGVSSEPDSLDPQKSSLAVSSEIYAGIFSRLFELQTNGKITPSLATSGSWKDSTTYVVDLRDDVKFHDGTSFTADDVVFTFNRALDPKFGSFVSVFFDTIERVRAVGAHQVRFELSRPSPALVSNLAVYGSIVSKDAVESKNPARHPVGTGPFVFKSWSPGHSIELERNANYFVDGRPYLGGVRFRFVANTEARVLALRSDEVDWVDAVPKQSVQVVQNDKGLVYLEGTNAGIPQHLVFNCSKPPFDNKALRQAICWAIDRKEIAKVAFLGTADPGAEEFGKDSPWFAGDDDPYAGAPNADMVRRKLSEAGYPKGITFKYLAWTSSPDAVATGQVIQQQLKKYGIKLAIEQIEISSWIERLRTKEYELTLRNYSGLTDPDSFWTRNWTSTSESNVSGYGSKDLDAKIVEAGSATKQSTRKAMYTKIRNYALRDGALFFTAYIPTACATRANVLGAGTYPGGDPRFQQVGFAR